uniref:A/G-specific adenine glycosylase n=2 Tax=Megasphaera TaxID=906 RepID=UPI00402646CC
YYDSWMDHFPTLSALAAASQDEVLRQWQGLGYYSRARHLHQAVQEVQAKYGGHVPENKKDVQSLKGVGDYTAGAILSLAYGQKEPAVDGNVLRIFARLYDIEENILSTPVKKKVTALVAEQLPDEAPGAFNEALMDLGAMICIPKHPRCQDCPLEKLCLAHRAGKEGELPIRLVKKKSPVEDITVVVVRNGSQWLVHRRPPKGLLASMWEFPNAQGKGEEGLHAVGQLLAQKGLTLAADDQSIGSLKSVFSHKTWQMTIYEGRITQGKLEEEEDWQWIDCKAYASLPWAGPHGKITAMV